MNARYTSVAVCAALLAAGPSAVAQQQQQKAAAASPTAPAPVAGVIPLGVTRIEAAAIAPGYRATKLLHQDVYNDAGKKIGKIEDLVVAPDGTLTAAVIEVGGFLGIGKHRVAIPVKQFTALHPKVTLPGATKEALKDLPEFVPA
ncbi:MAG: PRC-barrel domain-containing protein [Acidobacteria bacterium]|nr:PRC-barrel domain-containing protein [Acidobacteriota bacterium]